MGSERSASLSKSDKQTLGRHSSSFCMMSSASFGWAINLQMYEAGHLFM